MLLRGIIHRILHSDVWKRRATDHHVLGFGRTDPGPAPVRLPRQPDRLLRTEPWLPIAQLTDQRIRAHRGDRLSIGEMVETVSGEVEDLLSTQPIEISLIAWRTWAAATETPWPQGFHELLIGAAVSGPDEVEAAVHVQSDLAALMPQVVVARLSENRA